MSVNLLPVIMAGGSGSRLWPLSRTLYPKQFLALTSDSTMLQETIKRVEPLPHLPPYIICNESHRFIVAEQLRQQNVKHGGIFLEPVGRNTAPAITLAALQAVKDFGDPVLLVLAADHVIKDDKAFLASVENAIPLAEAGKLVTFGIVPTHPETGYGYIKQGSKLNDHSYKVDSFVEKPNLETAQEYLSSGEYYWNSGMFLFRASVFLNEIRKFHIDILERCEQALLGQHNDLDFIRLDDNAFKSCPDESVDYAVMEKTQDAALVPMNAAWSDVGSWSALWEINAKDGNENAIRGDVVTSDTYNSYIYSQNKLVATVGINNLVVVETKDAVLIAHKDKVQGVKDIVHQLKIDSRCEHLQHREIFRPWGSHDTISEGARFHVKKLTIKQGQRTATQIHHHRAEHWIVVSGTAKVHKGDQSYLITENESIYIPIGEAHAIENPGILPLEIIEVRTGTYLSEDDVIRIGDDGTGY
ncbi:mannose-1-phosphate guanylyltransferase/mannose-6-phosphate isomerase [Pantoea sp. JZ2]|uniref:mannose-1-phosphate guanylyltransferase/mannose-6-phosphate isomerase n=1 Tax=Pantoea sp. JZ2 TaxID=2654189 RepID=UPI002B45DEED|nr:mannose-1-phosphate guanylyltransferase/mannose-6-phosphate isomerase [Pantoea sp. JZ2]WRH12767.1 mannose-1-phosphate guanylyltransferase/mannose-6-phosphate isomerase [Pantoea sp. JZ2]